MAINKLALDAYQSALDQGMKLRQEARKPNFAEIANGDGPAEAGRATFADTISNALGDVNDLQAQKKDMIYAFASGENENVHELMISLQKASVAMKMTTAVRGKVMETYKELSKMSF